MTAPWEPQLTKAELADCQLTRLRWCAGHAYAGSPVYRRKFDLAGVRPQDIRSIKDLERLPFLTKADLREHYPFSVISVPEAQIVRIHASSGTTGRRTVAYYTQKDLNDWALMMARCYAYTGLTACDRIQITPGYGLWTAGAGFQAGAETLGAMAVPVGPAALEMQLEIMQDFAPTAMTGTSSYGLYLAEMVHELGLKERLRLRTGIFGSERWGEAMRRRIEALLGIETFDIIGMTETYGPGIGIDCPHHAGIHYWADYFIFEVIDPDTGQPRLPGELGELVITSLAKEAMPVLRYRTRDLTRLLPEPCPCGRVMPMIDRIYGRVDDGLKLRGVLLYPSDIDQVLTQIPGISSEYRMTITRAKGRDEALLQVEAGAPDLAAPDAASPTAALADAVSEALHRSLRVRIPVEIVPLHSLPRTQGKTKRWEDLREKTES